MKVRWIQKFEGETIGAEKPGDYDMRFSPDVWWKLEKDSDGERFVFVKDKQKFKELEKLYQVFKNNFAVIRITDWKLEY